MSGQLDKLFTLKKNWHRNSIQTFIYLIASIINKQKVPSAVVENIIRKLSTNKNVKTIKIWHMLNVQFGNEILSRSQICQWHKMFKNGFGKGETRPVIECCAKSKTTPLK